MAAGEGVHALAPEEGGSKLVSNALRLKGVLREGVPQDKAGPSGATEFGLLLPGIGDEHGVGGSIAGIVSQQCRSLTFHFNALAAVTREQHGDLFLSTIVEGPRQWEVQPAGEVSDEREFGVQSTHSLLAGAIWQVSDKLPFDAAMCGGRVGARALARSAQDSLLRFHYDHLVSALMRSRMGGNIAGNGC